MIENRPTAHLSAHITKKAQIINILDDIKGILIISIKKFFGTIPTKNMYNVTHLNLLMIILGISDSL